MCDGMAICDSCKTDAPLTPIVDMFGNEGNVCNTCRTAMEEEGCLNCGS